MTPRRFTTVPAVQKYGPLAALAITLGLAWANYFGTTRWAGIDGSLHGLKEPWYVGALALATVLAVVLGKRVGQSSDIDEPTGVLIVAGGAAVLLISLFTRLPLSSWDLFPFDDDWVPLLEAAIKGVRRLEQGAVMGWDWYFLGGYPTSTDVAQSFAALTFVPMQLFGDLVGFHVTHAIWLLAVPVYLWWDLHHEDRRVAWVAAGFGCLLTAGISVTLGKSGDVNSLAGIFSAGTALFGSRAARLGRRWGGPVMILGLTCALYSHVAFFVYAGIYLTLEAIYFRDWRAVARLAAAVAVAGFAALPVHWESLRYPEYVSFNNVVFRPDQPRDWQQILQTLYYNVEILVLPHRWFNDYRSLVNVWAPVLLVVAIQRGRTRVGFYAWAAVLSHALLRLNTGELGAGFDRIMHMLPMLAAPALAGFVVNLAGSRVLAWALSLVIALYCAVSFKPVPHVREVREFNPALIDRLASLDGNLILFEISPHRDMDSDPVTRTPKAKWNVHFEGMLPRVAGQRFYSQMWDGWVWSTFRGQVLGAGSFAGQAIDTIPPDRFVAEMRRWGVRHLIVWTDASRNYLARDGRFLERWREAPWSHFELIEADVRSVETVTGTASLTSFDTLGAHVALEGVRAGEPVVIRTNYYPAWRAQSDFGVVPLYDQAGQLAFHAPADGTYGVRLEYPKRRALSLTSLLAFIGGCLLLSRWPAAQRSPQA